MLAAHEFSKIERKAVGIVEPKRHLAVERFTECTGGQLNALSRNERSRTRFEKFSGYDTSRGSITEIHCSRCDYCRFEQGDPTIQRLIKRLLLPSQHFLHVLLFRADFGEDIAHFASED